MRFDGWSASIYFEKEVINFSSATVFFKKTETAFQNTPKTLSSRVHSIPLQTTAPGINKISFRTSLIHRCNIPAGCSALPHLIYCFWQLRPYPFGREHRTALSLSTVKGSVFEPRWQQVITGAEQDIRHIGGAEYVR